MPTVYTFNIGLSHPVDVAVDMTANTQDGSATGADDFTAVTDAPVSFVNVEDDHNVEEPPIRPRCPAGEPCARPL